MGAADLVAGWGEIGQAVGKVVGTRFYIDLKRKRNAPHFTPEILHICFPYTDNFIEQVQEYIDKYEPLHCIVWSTVPIGTCKMIADYVVHSPVEGRHPKLFDSIKNMRRWVGSNSPEESVYFNKYFKNLGLEVSIVDNTDFTEFLKLRSTAKFGINLVWTDYEKSVADKLKMDFGLVKDFDTDYNDLYEQLDMTWAKRYILDPPNGKIGGHCVIPNAEILDQQFPDDLLKRIVGMK